MKNIFCCVLILLQLSCTKKSATLLHEINDYRSERSVALTEGERAPLNTDEVKMLKYYHADQSYKCKCLFERFEKMNIVELPTYAGTTTVYKSYGKLNCKIKNDTFGLTIFQLVNSSQVYADKLFLPFKDETNGEESYGGGRYLDLSLRDMTNSYLEVDFNKAYNPLCAYKSGFRCPIPPPENHLKIKIEAGEKVYKVESP
jgi:uncharacterized protein (DUF1684 family)